MIGQTIGILIFGCTIIGLTRIKDGGMAIAIAIAIVFTVIVAIAIA